MASRTGTGSATKPNGWPSGVKARISAAARTPREVMTRKRCGRLRQQGAAVRMTKITRICVRIDSTNQAVLTRAGSGNLDSWDKWKFCLRSA